jgi:hypothetical protein
MTITLTREEAQQVLDALEEIRYADISVSQKKAIETLRAQLSQPEREWQGLTEGEIIEALSQGEGHILFRLKPFALAIEAKLKEKNA